MNIYILIEPLLTIVVILAIIFLFFRPKYSLFIFIASIPFELISPSDKMSLPKILGLIAIIGYFLTDNLKKHRIYLDKTFLFIYFFFIWGTLSYFWSYDPQLSLTRIFTLVQLLLLYFIITNEIRTIEDFDHAMVFLFFGAMIFAIFGIYDLIHSSKEVRLASIAQNANLYFVVSIFLIPCITWMFYRKKNLVLWLSAVAVFLSLLITSMYTQSRGGLVSLGVFLFVFFILTKRKLSWFLLASLIVLVAFWLAPTDYLSRFTLVGNDYLDRFRDIWPAGWNAFINQFWIGHGIGTSETIVPKYLKFTKRSFDTLSAHNALLATGIDLGLPGVILYLLFLAIPTYQLFKSIKRYGYPFGDTRLLGISNIFLSVLFAYLANWIKTGGMEYGKMLWIILGFESSLSIILRKDGYLKKHNGIPNNHQTDAKTPLVNNEM